MKKYVIVCAAICTALTFSSCGASKESAYRKAYEKAKAQEQAQQQGQQGYYGQQQYGQQQYVQQDPAQYQQPQQVQPQQQYQQQVQPQQQYQQPQQVQPQYQQPQQPAPTVTQLEAPKQQTQVVSTAPVQQTSTEVSSSNNGLKAFSVVVGAFGVRANAEGLQNTLKNAGYSGAQIIYDGKMYRVIASTSDVKENAVRDRDALKPQYSGAWIMSK